MKGKRTILKNFRVANQSFGGVEGFRYPGVFIETTGNEQQEVKQRIQAANVSYNINKQMLKNKHISKKVKLRIYKTNKAYYDIPFRH